MHSALRALQGGCNQACLLNSVLAMAVAGRSVPLGQRLRLNLLPGCGVKEKGGGCLCMMAGRRRVTDGHEERQGLLESGCCKEVHT